LPQPSLPPHFACEQFGVQTQEYVPADACWHTPLAHDPVLQIPPQPSEPPHTLAEQSGTHWHELA
jgi:hypothetical protein